MNDLAFIVMWAIVTAIVCVFGSWQSIVGTRDLFRALRREPVTMANAWILLLILFGIVVSVITILLFVAGLAFVCYLFLGFWI